MALTLPAPPDRSHPRPAELSCPVPVATSQRRLHLTRLSCTLSKTTSLLALRPVLSPTGNPKQGRRSSKPVHPSRTLLLPPRGHGMRKVTLNPSRRRVQVVARGLVRPLGEERSPFASLLPISEIFREKSPLTTFGISQPAVPIGTPSGRWNRIQCPRRAVAPWRPRTYSLSARSTKRKSLLR